MRFLGDHQIRRGDPHRNEHDLGTLLVSATLGARVRKPTVDHDEHAQVPELHGIEAEDSVLKKQVEIRDGAAQQQRRRRCVH